MKIRTWLTSFSFAIGLALLVLSSAKAQDSLSFGGTYLDDGSCEDPATTLEARYSHNGERLEVDGVIRVAPSGGDCRQDSISFDISAEYEANVWDGACDVLGKFGASEHAYAAPYAQVVNGMVDLRPDGNANFPVNLPSGVAKAVTGGGGVSCTSDFGEIDVTANIVPVDWSDGTSGQTVHLSWTKELENWEFGVDVDYGNDTFGDARLSWRHGIARINLEYRWGLNAISDGAPMYQMVRDARFQATGAPLDNLTALSVTFDVL